MCIKKRLNKSYMSFLNANQLVQTFVDEYGNTGRNYSVIDYVLATSRANTSINLEPGVFLNAPGKLRQVQVNYFPIQCGAAGSCAQNLCDDGTAVEPAQQLFTIGECISTPIYKINKNDIRLVDNNRWDFSGTARNIIASAMPNFRRLIATAFLTKLYTLAGVHLDGSEQKRIPTTDPNGGILTPMGRLTIDKEFRDGGFGEPNIIGGDEVYYWQNLIPIAGLNQNGINLGQIDNNRIWYDDGLSDSILNDLANGGHILAVDPQVFKFVTYSENAGIFSTGMTSVDDLPNLYKGNFPGFLEGSLVDPVTGLTFDLFMRYNECDGYWTFFFRLHWDMFVMPDVACNVQGVNGIMHYRTCPAIQVVCPAGSPVTSPAAAQTFAWTPTLSDLPQISNSIIGGVAYQETPPRAITTLADLAKYMNEAYSPGTNLFVVNGSAINYSGYTAIAGSFNSGSVTFTFA